MSKVLLISFFNSNNLGDILLSTKIHDDIKKLGFEVIKCSVEGSFDIKSGIIHKKRNRVFEFVIYHIKKHLFWRKYNKVIKATDIVVFGGGNLIMELENGYNSIKMIEDYINKSLNKPIFTWSIGIGPFVHKKTLDTAINLLEKITFNSFRDKTSFDLYNAHSSKLNSIQTVDPVLTYDKEITFDLNSQNILIGLINPKLLGLNSRKSDIVIKSYQTIIDEVLNNGYTPVLFSTEKQDYEIINQLEISSKVKIKYIDNLEDLKSIYSECRCVISARMHSLIFGFSQELPVYGLVWQDKVKSLLTDIIGSDMYCEILDISNNIDSIKEFFLRPQIVKYSRTNISDSYNKNVKIMFSNILSKE